MGRGNWTPNYCADELDWFYIADDNEDVDEGLVELRRDQIKSAIMQALTGEKDADLRSYDRPPSFISTSMSYYNLGREATYVGRNDHVAAALVPWESYTVVVLFPCDPYDRMEKALVEPTKIQMLSTYLIMTRMLEHELGCELRLNTSAWTCQRLYSDPHIPTPPKWIKSKRVWEAHEKRPMQRISDWLDKQPHVERVAVTPTRCVWYTTDLDNHPNVSPTMIAVHAYDERLELKF